MLSMFIGLFLTKNRPLYRPRVCLNTKLPASDPLRNPHPFRDMTDEGALTRSLVPSSVLSTMPSIVNGLGLPYGY